MATEKAIPLATERCLELLPELADNSEARHALIAGAVRAREAVGLGSTRAEYIRRVGSLMPNAFGLFDMHGNVFEWCQHEDGHPDEAIPDGEATVIASGNRLVRGGFLSHPRHLRSARRYRDLPILRNDAGGLRPVRSRPGPDR